jgi:GxxExxY protein
MDALNKLVNTIIEECKEVHATLERGLYASVYEQFLYQVLLKKGLFVQRQVPVYAPEENKEVQLHLKAEFVVENSVICEIKSVDTILPMHKKALATFLKLSNKPIGLLVNFKEPHLKNGIVKLVNNSYKKLF